MKSCAKCDTPTPGHATGSLVEERPYPSLQLVGGEGFLQEAEARLQLALLNVRIVGVHDDAGHGQADQIDDLFMGETSGL